MPEHLTIMVVPLLALLTMVVLFVVIPIFSNMTSDPAVEAGLQEMSNTLASFSPIYGIGLAIGILIMFLALATWFAGGGGLGGESSSSYSKPYENYLEKEEEEPEESCPYCLRAYTSQDLDNGYCGTCGAPIRKRRVMVR